MKILALDYGAKTVGAAVCDTSLRVVQGIEVIRRDRENKIRKTLVRIEELIGEYGIDMIVLGLPLNMDGSAGERAGRSEEFAELLRRRTGLSVCLHDERLSSVEADERMKAAGVPAEKRKMLIDMVAAEVILEDYLASPQAAAGENGTLPGAAQPEGESHGRI